MKVFETEQQILNGIISVSKKHITGDFVEHGHKFFEFEYVISGHGKYYIDGSVYPIQERSLFFMSPSDFHSLKDCDIEIINVMFTCDLCDSNFLYTLLNQDKNCVVNFSENDSILVESLLLEMAESNDVDYMIQLLRCLLFKLSKSASSNKSNIISNTPSHIQSAIIYILENFHSNITLTDTANHTKLAPAYLSTLFLKEMGTNFKPYLDQIRFEYAVKLLKYTSMTISEVCSSSGFSDYTNFTRRFKIKFGYTPTEYRKIYKKS